MKKLSRNALVISILALASIVTLAALLNPASMAAPIPDFAAAGSVGGSAWGDFFTGVTCGVGVGLLIGGYLGGVTIPAAALATVGIVSQCARALGL